MIFGSKNGYQPQNIPDPKYLKPPTGGSDVSPPPCKHKFIYLGQRRIADNYEKTMRMTKIVDAFYCEKCLEYRYKD